MKMTQEDFDKLKTAIENYIEENNLAMADVRTQYHGDYLTDMRFRWDLYHCVSFQFRHLYEYLNDDHIDTALRKITNTK